MEKERLRSLGYPNLAKKVKKAKFDYEGFDIKSFETNGDPRYIEVKATRSKGWYCKLLLISKRTIQGKIIG